MSADATLSVSRTAVAHDVRTIRRWGTAACMVVGPLAVAVVRGWIPYFTNQNGGAGQVASYTEHPASYPVVAAAAMVAVLTMWPAMQGAGRLIQRSAPRLALVAVPLATAGWIMVAVVASGDALAYELTGSGLSTAAAGALVDRVSHDLFSQIGFSVFIAGHLIGTLLIGVGFLVSKRVPTWAALAVILGDVFHPIAFLLLHVQILDAISYVILAAGMAGAARVVLTTPNEQWDLASWSSRQTSA